MNYHVCDACGDKYDPKRDGGGKIALGVFAPKDGGEVGPPKTGNSFLDQMLNAGAQHKSGPEEHYFDLCYECILGMALALKKQKADVIAGRVRLRS